MRVHDRFYIGGQWVEPAGTDTIEVISPHTEEVIGRVPDGTPADMDRAVLPPETRSTTARGRG
jgi:betaine-aldehyde dehydrogenase